MLFKMKKTHVGAAALILTLSIGCATAAENDPVATPGATRPKISSAAELSWRPAPGLPTGAHVALLDGDPAKQGAFTLRLKMPAGYAIPPHTHTTAERITVISGSVRLGIGEKFEAGGGRELRTGDFALVPAGVAHFASCVGEAVLQIHSEGPFERKFVD